VPSRFCSSCSEASASGDARSTMSPRPIQIFEKECPLADVGRDFRSLDIASLPRCDIFDSGAPCQAYSIAGRRRAGNAGRGTLMFDQLAYLRYHKPCGAIFEQVPNFLRLQKGELFRQFVSGLTDCGYRVHHRVLEARHYDSCQHQERLFIAATVGGGRWAIKAEYGQKAMTDSQNQTNGLPAPASRFERLPVARPPHRGHLRRIASGATNHQPAPLRLRARGLGPPRRASC
jgi:site-specific DNA-cytosine methylase